MRTATEMPTRLALLVGVVAALAPGSAGAADSLLKTRVDGAAEAARIHDLAVALELDVVFRPAKASRMHDMLFLGEDGSLALLERFLADGVHEYRYVGDCWENVCSQTEEVGFSVASEFGGSLSPSELIALVESYGATLGVSSGPFSADFVGPANILQAVESDPLVTGVGLFDNGGIPEDFFRPRTAQLGEGKRFFVSARFSTDSSGPLTALVKPVTADSAGFTFFDRDNIELDVKVLDGCGVNGHYWFFAAGLTDVPVTIRVGDQETGILLDYESPGGPFELIRDTLAFPCS